MIWDPTPAAGVEIRTRVIQCHTSRASTPLLSDHFCDIRHDAEGTPTNRESRIEIFGHANLKAIKNYAFEDFRGLLILNGTLSKLATIERHAFEDVGADSFPTESYPGPSVVELRNLPELLVIGHKAFNRFRGKVRCSVFR